MMAIRHGAVLALEPAALGRAPAPLLVGVFERLAVEREAVGAELVAARAEDAAGSERGIEVGVRDGPPRLNELGALFGDGRVAAGA